MLLYSQAIHSNVKLFSSLCATPILIFFFFYSVLAILGAVVCVAAIFGIIGTYVKKNMITYIYMIIIIGALVFQVMIGVKVYQKAANSAQYLTNLWPKSSIAYRANLQDQVLSI